MRIELISAHAQEKIATEHHDQARTGRGELSAASLAKELTKYGEMAQVSCLTCPQQEVEHSSNGWA